MNKTIKQIALLVMFLVSAPHALGAPINFGSASTCNLDDWSQFGDVSSSGTAGNCTAEINVDDYDYEAELWQEISFDAGTDYTLAVDFNVGTSFFDTVFDDVFSISLVNEDLDLIELFSMNITGIESISKSLAISSEDFTSFVNQGWSLSFFLYDGFDFDENSSFSSINNIYIEEVTTDVTEPSGIAIMALGFAGLMHRRKIAYELVRKTIKK